ncbi:MAG: metal-dependent hydrolase [Kiritimatiellae bacterium]|nr:metal-dependent hydrolase [Kiritimatiellia bacterium]
MKGITHFLTGVAAASCFPLAIRTAYEDKAYLMVLGGVCGILCDTLDFKFARYFWKIDHQIRLSEDHLDPRLPAEAIARAIDEAAEKKRPIRLKLDTIRVGPSHYRAYAVQIDDRNRTVTCTIGPLKTMSQSMARGERLPSEATRRRKIEEDGPAAFMESLARDLPCLPDTIPPGPTSHVASFQSEINNTYYMDTEIGVFSGPDYEFVPEKDGRVRVDFIPWHRRWTHSLTLGLLMGPIGFALFADWPALFRGDLPAFFTNRFAVTAFWIAILAFWSHVLVDQTGHLGSNLFPPFTKQRTMGLRWCTSASPFPNQMVNYISVAIILWNLNVFAPTPVFTMPWAKGMIGGFGDSAYYLVSLTNYLLAVVALPLLVFYWIGKLYKRWYRRDTQVQMEEAFSGEDWSGGIGDG